MKKIKIFLKIVTNKIFIISIVFIIFLVILASIGVFIIFKNSKSIGGSKNWVPDTYVPERKTIPLLNLSPAIRIYPSKGTMKLGSTPFFNWWGYWKTGNQVFFFTNGYSCSFNGNFTNLDWSETQISSGGIYFNGNRTDVITSVFYKPAKGILMNENTNLFTGLKINWNIKNMFFTDSPIKGSIAISHLNIQKINNKIKTKIKLLK